MAGLVLTRKGVLFTLGTVLQLLSLLSLSDELESESNGHSSTESNQTNNSYPMLQNSSQPPTSSPVPSSENSETPKPVTGYISDVTSKPVYLSKDGNTTLICAAKGSPIPIVKWTKKEGNANATETVCSNVSSITTNGQRNCHLNVKWEKGGIYYCVVAEGKRKNQTAKVIVNSRIHMKLSRKPIEVKGCGSDAKIQLNCTVIRYPPVDNVQWQNWNGSVLSNLTALVDSISTSASIMVKRPFFGKYTCKVQRLNKAKSVTVTPGTTCIDFLSADLSITNSETTRLHCVVSGARTFGAVQWLRHPSALRNNHTVKKTNITNVYLVNSTITINGQSGGGGVYTCQAGTAKENVTVNVFPHILNVSQLPSSLNCAGRAVLQCRARGYPKVNVWWQSPEGRAFSNGSHTSETSDIVVTSTLEIGRETALKNYTCVVNNRIGSVSQSFNISAIWCVEDALSFQVIGYSDEANLSCTASGSSSFPSLRWYRLELGNTTHLQKERTTVMKEDPNGFFSRTFSVQVSGKMGGVYKCAAAGNERTVTVYVNATVSSFRIETKPNDGEYGRRTTLACLTGGYPRPDVTLLYPNKTAIPKHLYNHANANSVAITVKLYLGGKYSCRANNTLPGINGRKETSHEDVVRINLRIRSKVVEPEDGTTVRIVDGHAENITCVAVGVPNLEMSWTLEKDPSYKLTTSELTHFNKSVSLFTKVLQLRAVSLNQNGSWYSCTAKRKEMRDSDSAKVFVIVTENVTIVRSPKSTSAKSGSIAEFFCEAQGTSAKFITWFKKTSENGGKGKNVKNVTSSSIRGRLQQPNTANSTLRIDNVSLASSGQYYCVAGTERYPFLASSKVATLGVLSNVKLEFPQRFIYLNASSVKFKCSFFANPKPFSAIRLNGEMVLSWQHPNSSGTEAGASDKWSVEYTVSPVNVSLGGYCDCLVRFQDTASHSLRSVINVATRLTEHPGTSLVIDRDNRTSLQLCCTAQGYPVPSITWRRTVTRNKTREIKLQNNATSVQSRTFRSCLSVHTDDRRPATVWDLVGDYTCSALNNVSLESSLTKVKAAPAFENFTKLVQLKWNEPSEIKCSAKGYPPPQITWQFRNIEMELQWLLKVDALPIKTTSRLVITAENSSAPIVGGKYKCVAGNDVGEIIKNVTAEFLQRLVLPPKSTTVSNGQSLVLYCEVSGYPVPTEVNWFIKGNSLISISHGNITTTPHENNSTASSVLVIPIANENDAGNYSCFGKKETHAEVLVGAAFLLNDRLVIAEPVGSKVVLNCGVRGSPPLTLGWEYSSDLENFMAAGANNVTETTDSSLNSNLPLVLTKQSTGYYRCWVLDSLRVRAHSRPTYLNATYAPESLKNSDSRHVCVEGIECSLTCEFDSNPQSTVRWSKKTNKGLISSKSWNIFSTGKMSSLLFPRSTVSRTGLFECCANNNLGENCSKIYLTVEGPPVAVEVNAVSILPYNITVSWRAPFNGNSPITRFNISLSVENDTILKGSVSNFPATSSSQIFTVPGLKPFTDYSISVLAINKRGVSPDRRLQFKTDASVPSPVRNVTADVLSSSSFGITWIEPAQPNGKIDLYRVYYQEKRTGLKGRMTRAADVLSRNVSGNETSLKLNKLEPYREYEIGVTAININNKNESLESRFKNPISAETEQDAPTAPQISSVRMELNQEKQLYVDWKKPSSPNGVIINYEISYRRSEATEAAWKSVKVEGNEKSFVLRDLTAYTNYTVKIRAITIKSGKNSLPVKGRTDEGRPSAPVEVTVIRSSVTSMEIQLKWKPPKQKRGIITDYQITYSGSKQYTEGYETKLFPSQGNVSVSKDEHQFVLAALQPDFLYCLRVSAFTSKGKGEESAPVLAKTDIAAPVKPLAPFTLPAIPFATTTTVSINLIQPSNLNGNISTVQLLVMEISFFAGVNKNAWEELFYSADVKNFSEALNSESPQVYVAAEFDFRSIPPTFVVGDGQLVGGYWNRPLQPGQEYKFALRSLVISNDKRNPFSTSDAITLKTASKSGGNVTVVATVVIIVLLIIIVVLIVLYLRIRQKKSKKTFDLWKDDTKATHESGHELVVVNALVLPAVTTEDTEVLGLEGDTTILLVTIAGDPKPVVTWLKDGENLPGDKEQMQLLKDGSLQIGDTRKADAGIFKCVAENSSGKESLVIMLKVQSGKQVCEKAAIPAAEFENYVRNMSQNEDEAFDEEYKLFEKVKVPELEKTIARLDCNRGKNRYANVVPYDHCRVVLNEDPTKPGSDYINASYMKGFDGEPDEYIATQGPTERTLEDFWRMIWEKKVPTIVMVTNLEEREVVKCNKYWVEEGAKQLFGAFLVESAKEVSMEDCVVRTLSVFAGDERHSVTLFHFTGWPDHNVPSNAASLLSFVKRARHHHNQHKEKGPMVVHCSAGVGRTGTFIAVDCALQHHAKFKTVDVFNTVLDMRKCRPLMVQTATQYYFCHSAVLEHLLCGNAAVSVEKLQFLVRTLKTRDPRMKLTGYEKHMELLNRMSPSLEDFTFITGSDVRNASKNRYSHIYPPDSSRVHLVRNPETTDRSTYVNAYFLDGYRQQNLYIAAQCPLESTITDFWRVIWQQNCRVIIMLTDIEEGGETMSAMYWPSEGSLDTETITITFLKDEIGSGYVLRYFQLTSTESDETVEKNVIQMQCLDWTQAECPRTAASVLGILEELERVQRQLAECSHFAVICNNGVDRSGTFCAIHWMLEKLKTEQIVDVFQVIKALRKKNAGIVASRDHYQFCYKVATEFLDSFSIYANFKSL